MSYLIACMLSSFIVGLIVGIIIESSARKHFYRNKEDK